MNMKEKDKGRRKEEKATRRMKKNRTQTGEEQNGARSLCLSNTPVAPSRFLRRLGVGCPCYLEALLMDKGWVRHDEDKKSRTPF